MPPRVPAVVLLAAMLLLGGCVGPAGPGTPRSDASPTTMATRSKTPSPTPTATPPATPAPVDSLPSPSECLTDAVPRPGTVDGVGPSAYPEPPADVTRDSLVNWTQTFERAYFRNGLLTGELDDDDNLTEVTAYPEVRSVNHTPRGYVIRFSDFGATNYASGVHGDHWMDVGYVVNATHVVRVPLDDRADPVRASEGTVVVACR